MLTQEARPEPGGEWWVALLAVLLWVHGPPCAGAKSVEDALLHSCNVMHRLEQAGHMLKGGAVLAGLLSLMVSHMHVLSPRLLNGVLNGMMQPM